MWWRWNMQSEFFIVFVGWTGCSCWWVDNLRQNEVEMNEHFQKMFQNTKLTANLALKFIRLIATSVRLCAEDGGWPASTVVTSERTVIFFTHPEFSLAGRFRLVTSVLAVNYRVAESVLRNTSTVIALETRPWTFCTCLRYEQVLSSVIQMNSKQQKWSVEQTL